MTKRTAMVRLSKNNDIYAKVLATASYRASRLFPNDPLLSSLPGMVRGRHWKRVIETAESLEVQQHSSILDQYVKTQLVALIKKYPFTTDEVSGFDPEAAAWKKFLAAEHRCKRVNQRSLCLRGGDGFRYSEFFRIMRGYIVGVIGEKPNFERIYDLCDYGPGASVGVNGDRTNFARKFLADSWTCTPLALSYCTQALWKQEQLRHLLLGGASEIVCLDREKFTEIVSNRVQLVSHNNISFVPKSFKTKRSIATEPLLNGYLQKGIDQFLRERLARVGIDLRDQETNSQMARDGSLGGFNPYVTIDLSSASDSLPISVVRMLLPPAWYDFLNRARSHLYSYRGRTYVYEKFVSMGNGFCFPLQTLIFSAICHAVAVCHRAPIDFRVYGDDIIVRQSEALVCIEVLRYLGFRTNPDKTFIFGPFRESCGTDWYSGQDIRPVYLDNRFESNLDLYKFHNATKRSAFTYGFFTEVRDYLMAACPPEVRFVRPYHGNAESAFTADLDHAMRSKGVYWNRKTMAWSWYEVQTTSVRDHIHGSYGYDICNALEYLAVLRGGSSRVPLAVRRKTRARVVRKCYWGVPGHEAWKHADPVRPEED